MQLDIRGISKTYPNGVQALKDVTLTMPQKPDRAGIDPYNLLDWEAGDNIEEVRIEHRAPEPAVTPLAGRSRGAVPDQRSQGLTIAIHDS